MQGNKSVQERIKEHSRDSQFAYIKTSAESKANISWKGERGRGPVDSRAVYTREIIGSLNNTRTACIDNTFIRDLCEPRFCKPNFFSRTHIKGPIPVLRKPRLTLAIENFFFLQYSRNETIVKIGHLAKAIPCVKWSVWVRNKKKNTKNMPKTPFYKNIGVILYKRNARKNSKYSRIMTQFWKSAIFQRL